MKNRCVSRRPERVWRRVNSQLVQVFQVLRAAARTVVGDETVADAEARQRSNKWQRLREQRAAEIHRAVHVKHDMADSCEINSHGRAFAANERVVVPR